MTRRRRSVKARNSRPGRGASKGDRPAKPRAKLGGWVLVVVLGVLSAVLLSISFAPLNYWFAAYVALVPWMLILDIGTTRRWALFWGWMVGVVFWGANLYWLWWITLIGYAAMVVYLSAYWFVGAVVLRAAMRRKWPMWIVLPVVWVGLEYARVYVISGFPWLFLAHSQYARTGLIQIADVTGQYGVSFFVAMVNGAVVDILRWLLSADHRTEVGRGRIISAVVAPLIVGGVMVGYGVIRVRQWEKVVRAGPVIGIVQQAFPISLTGRGATSEKIFADHLAASRKFVGRNCDLVIWPETMLPQGMNPEMLGVDPSALSLPDLRSLGGVVLGAGGEALSDDDVLRGYLEYWIEGGKFTDGTTLTGIREQAEIVGELSRKLGCPILAGGSTIHRNFTPTSEADRWVTRNSAIWFDRTAWAAEVYSKRHLVPFSEYVPFKKTWGGLHRLLRQFVPPVMAQLEPGRGAKVFELTRGGRTWRLAAPICYEGTFARICRQMTLRDGTKRVDILANLSNDGWFVYRKPGGSYQGSTEHAQHLVQYCFRAVENRVPVIRAVNTGISASIDSSGRIVGKVGLTLDGYTKHTMVPGTLLLDGAMENDGEFSAGHGPQVLVDARVSVYSLVGDVFAMAVSVAAALLAGRLGWRRRRGKSASGPTA